MSDNRVIITFKDKSIEGKFKAVPIEYSWCNFDLNGKQDCYFWPRGRQCPEGVMCNGCVFERIDE